MPPKAKPRKKLARRRNCAYIKPLYTKKQFEEMAAKGIVGPFNCSHPGDILDGKRRICVFDSLINEDSFRRTLKWCGSKDPSQASGQPDHGLIKAAVEDGRIGYVVVFAGMKTRKVTLKRPAPGDVSNLLATKAFADAPAEVLEIQCELKPEDCHYHLVDFSQGIYYDPNHVAKDFAEKLKYFFEEEMNNPAAIGRMLGYTEEDICAFYKKNSGYARCMQDMRAAARQGVPAPASTPPEETDQTPEASRQPL